FCAIKECRMLPGARRMPSVLDANINGVIVSEPVAAEATQVVVTTQHRLQVDGNRIAFFRERQYHRRTYRDDATLVVIGKVLLELVLRLAKCERLLIDVPVLA